MYVRTQPSKSEKSFQFCVMQIGCKSIRLNLTQSETEY